MRLSAKITTWRPLILAVFPVFSLAFSAAPGRAQQPAAPAQQPAAPAANSDQLDVKQLFATTCGWCHSDGGRVAGKGPQLMDTKRDDDFIRNRIKNGKEGAMPAFGGMFNDAQIDQIIKYIRNLKPDQG
ncbi:MAG TPA: cytochrome c [Bradyrhizobium sp.]|uniref:c-type cytochrome n=1 Tax=Bradyrhizobium sp. TaxID=376 RepID=UPI002D1C7E0A|nr:cytochrome c [Bradyrhizobium sp.]HLZ02528.1 cytochrome c [Bradyrhizobium sp.]